MSSFKSIGSYCMGWSWPWTSTVVSKLHPTGWMWPFDSLHLASTIMGHYSSYLVHMLWNFLLSPSDHQAWGIVYSTWCWGIFYSGPPNIWGYILSLRLGSHCSTELLIVDRYAHRHTRPPFQVLFQPELLAEFRPKMDQKTHRTPVQFAPEPLWRCVNQLRIQFAIVWTSP